jgi:porphobilinogen deaminase
MGTQSITLHASVFSADGSESINIEKSDVISNAAKIGKQVANDLLSRGAGDFAHEWREALEKWSIQK